MMIRTIKLLIYQLTYAQIASSLLTFVSPDWIQMRIITQNSTNFSSYKYTLAVSKCPPTPILFIKQADRQANDKDESPVTYTFWNTFVRHGNRSHYYFDSQHLYLFRVLCSIHPTWNCIHNNYNKKRPKNLDIDEENIYYRKQRKSHIFIIFWGVGRGGDVFKNVPNLNFADR